MGRLIRTRTYRRVLAVGYALGASLHLLDLFDLRRSYSTMDGLDQLWLFTMLLAEILASVGLWRARRWGMVALAVAASSQLMRHMSLLALYGLSEQLWALGVVGLHATSIAGLILVRRRNRLFFERVPQ